MEVLEDVMFRHIPVEDAIMRQNQIVLDSLKLGDMLEVRHLFYSHYGIYIGYGQVVHRTGDGHGIGNALVPESMSSASGVVSNKAEVREESFWDFAGGRLVFKNNCPRRLSPEKIVENACRKIGDRGYNVLSRNCEHFTNWCQTGTASSSQVVSLAIGLTMTVGFNPLCGLVWFFGRSFFR